MGKEEKRYKAFISYSRKDEKFVKKLHISLEEYKIPKELYNKHSNLPKKLSPIFRDIEYLRSGDSLSNEIVNKLHNSENLIVVCSPNSAKSKWVNKEIIDFKKMNGESKIFPIIIDGTPNSNDKNECFPDALKYKIDNEGRLTNNKSDILASNIIKNADGKKFAQIKLISGILGVENDELWSFEEKRNKKKRIIWWTIGTIVALIIMGFATFAWIQKNRAKKELIQSNYNLGLSLLEKAQKKIKEKDIATAHLFTYLALQKLNKKIDKKNNIAKARSIIASNPFYIPCAVVLNKHINEVTDIDITSDNKLLASVSSWNGNIRFWNMNTQIEEFVLNDDNKTHIHSIDFSPDNRLLAVASSDNISLWDIKKRKKIYVFKGHTSTVNNVKFSPNGRWIASASLDQSIRIWDIKTKKEISMLTHDDVSIKSIIFIDNETLISTSSLNIELWDLKNKKLLKSVSTGMDDLENIDISKDKKMLALGGRVVKVKDLTNNKIIFQSERDIRTMVNSVKFSPNGKILATCSSNGTIELWNIKSRKKIALLRGHTSSINDIEFSKDGLTLISSSDDKTIRFWDISNIENKNFKFKRDGGGTNDIIFSKTGKLFASTGYWSNNIYLWDTETLHIQNILKGHTNKVKKLLFSSDEKKIFSASDDGTIKIWDLENQKNIKTLIHEKNSKTINKITSLDDLDKMQQTWMTDIIFGKDENILISSGWNKKIKIWNLKNNKLVYTFPEFNAPITSLILSKIDKSLIFASISNYIVILKLNQEPLFLENNCFTHTLALSHNNKILASGMADGTIILWDLKTRNKKNILNGHLSSSIDLSFTPDDKYLATASDDGIIIIWDIKNKKEWARIIGYTDNSINCVLFSPDGNQLFAGLGDGDIYFWDMKRLSNISNTSFQNKEIEKLKQQLSIKINDIQLLPKIYNSRIIFGWSQYHPYYWLDKAQNGNIKAMYQLAIIYDRHNQEKKALKWYQKALNLGYKRADEKIKFLNRRIDNKKRELFLNLLEKIMSYKKNISDNSFSTNIENKIYIHEKNITIKESNQ